MTSTEKMLSDLGLFIVMMGIYLFMAFPFKWAWNYSMTYVFDLPAITWLHAYCLMWVGTALFKNVHYFKGDGWK